MRQTQYIMDYGHYQRRWRNITICTIWQKYQVTGTILDAINQLNFYSANIPRKARLSGMTAEMVFNSNIEESSATSMGHRACWCLRGKGQVKDMCLQMFLEGSNWNCWTDRQRQVAPKRRSTRVKCSCTCVGLGLRDRQTNTFVWSQWTGWEWCGKHAVK